MFDGSRGTVQSPWTLWLLFNVVFSALFEHAFFESTHSDDSERWHKLHKLVKLFWVDEVLYSNKKTHIASVEHGPYNNQRNITSYLEWWTKCYTFTEEKLIKILFFCHFSNMFEPHSEWMIRITVLEIWRYYDEQYHHVFNYAEAFTHNRHNQYLDTTSIPIF